MKHDAKQDRLLNLVFAGLFASLTALLTAALHIPVTNGYVHCGDAMIYLSAALLPLPYAAGASAVGGALADLLSGYPIYALPTFLIKAMLAACFSRCGGDRLLCRRRFLGMVLCGLISVTGYWVTEVILLGGWRTQFIATVPGNCMQAIASAVVYVLIAAGMRNKQAGGSR